MPIFSGNRPARHRFWCIPGHHSKPGPFTAYFGYEMVVGDITTARTTYRQALSDHEAGYRSR